MGLVSAGQVAGTPYVLKEYINAKTELFWLSYHVYGGERTWALSSDSHSWDVLVELLRLYGT